MIGRVLALTAALLLATSFTARAQDEEEEEEEESYYAKDSAAYGELTAGGGEIGGNETGAVGLILGGHVEPWLAFEAQYEFVSDSATHLATYSAKWLPLPESRIQPYLKTGLGLMGGRSQHPFLFMGRFGGGVEFFLTEQLALDAGATAGIATHDNNLYSGNLGLIYYFE